MGVYIYVCSNQTEQECFDRKLLGSKREYTSGGKGVRKGDTLFLYNFSEGVFYGEMVAVSDGGCDIVKEAWDGDYKWQVCFEWVQQYQPLHKIDIKGVIKFGRQGPERILSQVQYRKLMELFKGDQRLPKEEIDYRKENSAMLLTDDGHYVRSRAEQIIDNWLYENRIVHAFEVPLGRKSIFCDFYIPEVDLYIEYWGLKEEQYVERRDSKICWYETNKKKLLQIFPKDLKKIEKILAAVMQ